jgi:hypothetical protein
MNQYATRIIANTINVYPNAISYRYFFMSLLILYTFV